MYRPIVLLPLLLAVAAGRADAQQSLNDAAIGTLLSGKSAVFDDYSIATYGKDGAYSYVAANNLYYHGKYAIAGGKLCISVDGGQKRCDGVSADAQSPYLVTSAGAVLRFGVRAASPPQHVAKLCGLEVAYTVYAPGSDVPKNVAEFSGAWVGTWDYGMCGALIVESVKADGAVSAIYINGEYGQERPIRPGTLRFPAYVMGKTLTDGGVQTRFDAVMTGANELSVTRIGPPGQGTAKFNRMNGQ